MADRFCNNCGNELRPDDKFCPNCSRPVHETAVCPLPRPMSRFRLCLSRVKSRRTS
jgi:predicted amidophosphoribosyltransferase